MTLAEAEQSDDVALRECAARRREFVREIGKTLGYILFFLKYYELSMLIFLNYLCSVLKDQQLSEIRVGTVMREVFAAARRYGVQIEPNFATLVVGTAVIEGVGRQVCFFHFFLYKK